MDAIAQFEFMPEFNVWLGRMLPPSDRANLYGPFYALPWSYPGVASNYPNLAVGRDNGAPRSVAPLAWTHALVLLTLVSRDRAVPTP